MKKINKIVFSLSLLLLLLFPFGVIFRISPIRNVNIYPQDIVVGVISLILLFVYLKKRSPVYKKIFYGIVGFNAVAIISLLLSQLSINTREYLISLSYLLRFDAYIMLIFIGIISFSRLQLNILKKAFLLSSLAVLIFGFIQYFFYNNLRNLYYLGWDEHLYRMFSTFLDPNYAGLIFVLISIFIFGNFIIGRKIKENIFYIDSLVISISAVLLTYSRTAFLSLLLGFGVMLVFMKKVRLFLVIMLVFVIGLLLVSDLSIEGMNPLRIASAEARLESMEEAFQIFYKNPVLGVGFNTYRYAQVEEGFRTENLSIVSNADAGTDNSLLFILATTGIVGFTAYIFLWFQIINLTQKTKDRRQRITSYSIIAALFLGSQFVNALFYAPIMLWAFLYIGIFAFNHSER